MRAFAKEVCTDREAAFVLDMCAFLEERDEFECGPAVTVKTVGEVMGALLVLARWDAFRTEAAVAVRSAERARRLVDSIRNGTSA